ncbi:MAG: segregation/condensation protein A [Deltaproteobacteria bacterium]|nr:segregation/condensation protein A [Deltaproteobacteria bacterium]
MDLLLHLIRKHEIDIYDIPIALITKEYLNYLDLMKTLNLDMVGDFLVLAATLTQIKSKMLLPIEESGEEEDGTDPRAELVERLLEYKKFKEAAQELRSQENLWIDTYGIGAPTDIKAEQEVVLINLNLLDLMEAFRKVLRRPNAEGVHEVTVETMSIKEKISWIMDTLAEQSSIRFEDLFPGLPPRQEVIVTFLALLEIIRLRLVRIEQTERFGPIRIRKAVEREGNSGEPPLHSLPEQPNPEES